MFVKFVLILCVCNCFGFLDGKLLNTKDQLKHVQDDEPGNQPRHLQDIVTFVSQKIEGMERLLAKKDERVDQLELNMASQEQALLQKDAVINILAKRVSDLEAIVMRNPVQEKSGQRSYVKSNMQLPSVNITTKPSITETSSFETDDVIQADDYPQLPEENDNLNDAGTNEEVKIMPVSKRWRSRQNRVAVQQAVAFHTALSVTKAFKTGATIIYDHETLDHGDGYNPTDGLYLVPETGTYVLTWTTLGNLREEFQTVLVVNGAVRGSSFSDASAVGDYHQSTSVVVLTLNQGDHLFIRMEYTALATGTMISNDNRYGLSTFSGWKLD